MNRPWTTALLRSALLAALLTTACSELPRVVPFDGPLVAGDAGISDAPILTDADQGLVDQGADAAAATPSAFDWRDGIM